MSRQQGYSYRSNNGQASTLGNIFAIAVCAIVGLIFYWIAGLINVPKAWSEHNYLLLMIALICWAITLCAGLASAVILIAPILTVLLNRSSRARGKNSA